MGPVHLLSCRNSYAKGIRNPILVLIGHLMEERQDQRVVLRSLALREPLACEALIRLLAVSAHYAAPSCDTLV
jgi:hypothetical protein